MSQLYTYSLQTRTYIFSRVPNFQFLNSHENQLYAGVSCKTALSYELRHPWLMCRTITTTQWRWDHMKSTALLCVTKRWSSPHEHSASVGCGCERKQPERQVEGTFAVDYRYSYWSKEYLKSKLITKRQHATQNAKPSPRKPCGDPRRLGDGKPV